MSNKSTTYHTNTNLSGAIIYLKVFVKKGHYSKNIANRVMSIVMQMHVVMMSKYSKFGVHTFNTFWVMGFIKIFVWWLQQQQQQQQQRSCDHNSLIFFFKTDKLKIHCNWKSWKTSAMKENIVVLLDAYK